MKHRIIIVGMGIPHTALARLVEAGVTIVNEIPKEEPIEFKIKPMELDWMDNVKVDDIPRNRFFDKPRHNYKK